MSLLSARKKLPAVAAISIAAGYLLTGCGGDWPYPPGVQERGRRRTDTWEQLRRGSPWKKPISQDPVYQRLAENYRRMEEVDRAAELSGWKATEEYRRARFLLDIYYSHPRASVFRTRSSGTEDMPSAQERLKYMLDRLENYLEEMMDTAINYGEQ